MNTHADTFLTNIQEQLTPIDFSLWLASSTSVLKKIIEKGATWRLRNVTKAL
jgi:hypothetical protein